MPSFSRIAIVNRGEPAVRLIRAVRDLNAKSGDVSLQTIALFTDPDKGALFVREADDAFCLGPATGVDSRDGATKSTYLHYGRLEEALRATRADAVWVGWGFVAEHAEFADLCQRMGVTFVGPSGAVMRQLGDKIASKRLAEAAGVPVSAWSGGPVESVEHAEQVAEQIGFPLMIKASAGGGGRGIRKVERREEVAEALQRSRSEALKSFGDATVFIERMVQMARHVEVQIIADTYGEVWAVGVRDCTVQRRNQKVIEEAPSPVLTTEQDAAIREAAAQLARAAGYVNAGTVEFLYEATTQRFYFMEMNTRLQVEHPVTELTTGLDLVKLQLQIAAGAPLQGTPPTTIGHAIEVRLNAEDPDNNFAPSPGKVVFFRAPAGPGLRVDAGVSQGDVVPPDFDSMISKIIAHGRDRTEALARLQRALLETTVVIEGGTTNKAFLLELARNPDVLASRIDIGWLDRTYTGQQVPLRRGADVALVQAAVEVYDREMALERARFLSTVARGRPESREETGLAVELRHLGQTYKFDVRHLGHARYRITVGGRRLEAEVQRHNSYERVVTCFGERWRTVAVAQGPGFLIEVCSVVFRITLDEGGVVAAPAPAIVLSVHVAVGDEVQAGDRIVMLEAMKMEMPVTAPYSGKVRQVGVSANTQVGAGDLLIVLEPVTEDRELAAGTPVIFPGSGKTWHDRPGVTTDEYKDVFRARCRQVTDDLRCMLLGLDVDPRDSRWLLREYATLRPDMPSDDEEMLEIELGLLGIFADIIATTGGRQAGGASFNRYLRDIDGRAEGLPEDFVAQLRGTLAHYDVSSLDRDDALTEALYWIHKSNRRMDQSVDVVTQLLERQWENRSVLSRNDAYRDLLDRLIEGTQTRYSTVNNLARQMRFSFFDQRHIENARARQVAETRRQLALLIQADSEASSRALHFALANGPQPILGVIAAKFEESGPDLGQLLMQLYLERFYRGRQLKGLKTSCSGPLFHGLVEYTSSRGTPVSVVATSTPADGLRRAIRDGIGLLESRGRGEGSWLMDLLVRGGGCGDSDASTGALVKALSEAGLPERITRVCVSVLDRNPDKALHFTFQNRAGQIEEELLYRGIHHMQAERLELWRLRNFLTRRRSASTNIFIFEGAAKETPKDVRLFAFIDVRDLSPLRDTSGRVVELPNLERMFAETMARFRELLYKRGRQRPTWNRAYINSWMPLPLQPDELDALATRLALHTKDLGLEKIVLRGRLGADNELDERAMQIIVQGGVVLRRRIDPLDRQPIRAQSPYSQQVAKLRRRGLIYPYEVVRMLTPRAEGTSVFFPLGEFVEYDLDQQGRLAAVERPYGENQANVVVGLISNITPKHPEGMKRVTILSDPSRGMGALAEPECRRIIGALDLATTLKVPVEWFPISAGAKISMTSGTENLDWTARVLRRLIEFTQGGGEVNVIIAGINVGAQSYWNAEATMLMHTRGILVMTPEASMVLTGSRALSFSGSVSAETNVEIGGIGGIMGPNGQAQFVARDITHACFLLFTYYEHTYVAPGERFPRRGETRDPIDRDIREAPHDGGDDGVFDKVGQIFAQETNPERKKPFAIRSVMRAVIDRSRAPLERWSSMRNAETAVVMEAHLGGHSVCLIGIESSPVQRKGFIPGDGPVIWSGGTLFPLSSKKVARALNAASGNRPAVILANLAGFDGSPESMRKLQLEYGAEIGRAVVNFDGPIVFLVISRYHGGAYVVFSKTLNEHLEVSAVEGSYASVIGGAPAAAVVFPGEVRARAYSDPRLTAIREQLDSADEDDKLGLYSEINSLLGPIQAEKQQEVASEFDRIHSIERAREVGSVDHIIPAAEIRRYLCEAVERGIKRYLER